MKDYQMKRLLVRLQSSVNRSDDILQKIQSADHPLAQAIYEYLMDEGLLLLFSLDGAMDILAEAKHGHQNTDG